MVAFTYVLALAPLFASEVATSSADSIPSYMAKVDDKDFFKKLYQCERSVDQAGPMNTYGKTLCAHGWISPVKLPEKLDHVSQLFDDRIDVYDIKPYRGKVDHTNRHAFNLRTDACFSMHIPSPDDAESRFDCARTECDFGGVTPRPKPSRVVRAQKDAIESVEAIRSAFQPSGIDQYIHSWMNSSEGTSIFDRGGQEAAFKRAVCDCRAPDVVDQATLAILTSALRAPAAKYGVDDKNKARLRALADELDACGESLVSRL